MGNKRQAEISKSIHRALLKDPDRVKKGNIIAGLLAFFAIWKIRLMPIAAALFQRLRNDVWKIDENEYRNSFRYEKGESRIEPMGDLGYSGSVSILTLAEGVQALANSTFLRLSSEPPIRNFSSKASPDIPNIRSSRKIFSVRIMST
jgi:hypothetical protein